MSAQDPGKALVTVKCPEGHPTIEVAARLLGVKRADLDAEFGVAAVDPTQGLYAVRVRADSLPADFERRTPFAGPFADPRIAHFGRVQEAPDPAAGPGDRETDSEET